MSTVSVNETENIANSLKTIASILKSDYDSITGVISQINSCLDTLQNWNGLDAISEPYPYEEIPLSDGFLGNFFTKKQYYKYIWNIQTEGENNANNTLSNTTLKQIQENIDLLDMNSDDLNLLAGTLYGFITTIGSLLQVNYDGDIKTFFSTVKDTEGWQEAKKMAEEAKVQKEVDELYLKFRSTDGNDDYVDFILDELGNRRFPQGIEGVLDDGNQGDRGSSKYGQWYINYYLNHEDSNISEVKYMDNDAAFCAASVSYAFVNSGNEDAITPFIAVDSGAVQAKASANNGNGTWHSASDTSYQPKRGDIFYKVGGENGNHTGIVLGSDENYIYTIEGNTASDFKEGWSFGTVNTRVRDKSYINTGHSLAGYYSPNVTINQSVINVEISQDTIDNKLNPTKMNNNNN